LQVEPDKRFSIPQIAFHKWLKAGPPDPEWDEFMQMCRNVVNGVEPQPRATPAPDVLNNTVIETMLAIPGLNTERIMKVRVSILFFSLLHLCTRVLSTTVRLIME
jgi:hypothetical protein